MKKTTKGKMWVYKEITSIDYLNNSVDELIDLLETIKEENDHYKDLHVSYYWNKHAEGDRLSISGKALETDDEYQQRLNKQKSDEAAELALYKQLKKKYEKQ